MISKLFIVSDENGIIIEKNYRFDVDKNCEALFLDNLKTSKTKTQQPHFIINKIHFYNIRREGVYFVACSAAEMSPIFVIEMLSRFYHICRDFCGVVNEQSIMANILLIYELLEEILNEGYVQLLTTEKLRPYVQSNPVVTQIQKSPVSDVSEKVFGIETKVLPASSSTKPVVQTSQEGDSKRNEIFVDVIERMTTIINLDGSVSRIEVNGAINVKNFLACRTQVKIKLNEDLVISGDALKGYGSQVQIDRCKFHPCVNDTEFYDKRLLVLDPPIGEFAAMSYNITGDISLNPPFKLQMKTEDLHGSRDKKLVLRLQCDIPSKYEVLNIVVNIPVPIFVSSVSSKLGTESQTSELREEQRLLIWKVKKMSGKTDALAEFRLISQRGTGSSWAPYDVGPVALEFEISGYTCTGLVINQMNVKCIDKNQPAKKFIRYMTVNDSYIFRT